MAERRDFAIRLRNYFVMCRDKTTAVRHKFNYFTDRGRVEQKETKKKKTTRYYIIMYITYGIDLFFFVNFVDSHINIIIVDIIRTVC